MSKFFVSSIAVFSIIYLVLVATGAYNVILSMLSHVTSIPEWLVLTSQHHMSLLLALSLLYTYFTTPARRGSRVSYIDYVLGIIAFAASIYRFAIYHELSLRIGITTAEDILFGWLTVILTTEAIRRRVGRELAIVVLAFIAYGLWDTKFDFKLFIEKIYLFNIGIYSTPLQVAVLMITVFLLFGSMLEQAGIAEYFSKVATAFAGKRRGGPAKVTVVSTALLGTSTGSATGATAIIGTITIPTMIKLGLTPEVAAAITAACGTGAQIMPPVLGSAGFIMPLYLGVTYWYVVVASIVPAVLYYLYLYLYVDLMSKKLGLRELPESEIPKRREVLRELYAFTPIALLVYLLSIGFEAGMAALGSLLSVLIIAALRYGKTLGMLFSTLILVTFAVFAYQLGSTISSIMVTSALSILMVLALLGLRSSRSFSNNVIKGFQKSFREASSIILTCAGAGIIAGVLSLSGLSYSLGRIIWDISGGNMFIVLLISMFIAILLGFGLPTPVVYVTLVSILGGLAALIGVPKIALHYFIFYFGVFAPLTPPVALATFAAASIAKADFWKAGITAFAMTLASWIIAWGFILRPDLLLVTVGELSLLNVTSILVESLVIVMIMVALLIAYTGVAWWSIDGLKAPMRILYGLIAVLGFVGLMFYQFLPAFAAIFVVVLAVSLIKNRLKRVDSHAPQVYG